MEILMSLTALGGLLSGLAACLAQVRKTIRDVGDRRLARYVFDETRSIESIQGYWALTRGSAAEVGKSSVPGGDRR